MNYGLVTNKESTKNPELRRCQQKQVRIYGTNRLLLSFDVTASEHRGRVFFGVQFGLLGTFSSLKYWLDLFRVMMYNKD